MKSISKYCTPLKAEIALELCSWQIFSRSVSSSAKLHLVQKGIKAVIYPVRLEVCLEHGALAALNWAMGDGRVGTYCHQEQKHQQWEQVKVLIQMTLKLGRAWIQALTLLLSFIWVSGIGEVLISDGLRHSVPLPCPAQQWPQGGGSEGILKSLEISLAGLQKYSDKYSGLETKERNGL